MHAESWPQNRSIRETLQATWTAHSPPKPLQAPAPKGAPDPQTCPQELPLVASAPRHAMSCDLCARGHLLVPLPWGL